MTETDADRIAAALRLIRRSWDAMLPDAPKPSGRGEPTTGSRTPPPPAPVHVLSLRRDVCEILTSWCRLVIEEVVDIRGQSMEAHLDAKDAPALAGWLMTWADWLGGSEYADDAVRELSDLGRRCEDVATQRRTRRFKVGPCVDHATTDMGERIPCPGTLVAVLSTEDDLLPSSLRCTHDPAHAYSAGEWRRLGERIHSAVTIEEATRSLARAIVTT